MKIFNKGLILPSGLNFYIYSLKIFIDDDDDEGGGDDDDVVERTRTGPSAVRSDLEHQVTVTMMLKQSFFTTFSAHTKKAGQQSRARRGVWPYKYYIW